MTEQWLSTLCKTCKRFIASGFTSPLPVAAQIECNDCHAVHEYQTDEMKPEWLRQSWESSKHFGLDKLSPEEIDAEIAAARRARNDRHHPVEQ